MGLNIDRDEINRRLREIELAKVSQSQAAQARSILNEQQQRWIHNFVLETARDIFVQGFDRYGDFKEQADSALENAQMLAEAFGLIRREMRNE